MHLPQLPDFEQALSQSRLDAAELSECHGVACGLLSRKPDANAGEYIRLLGELELVTDPPADQHRALQALLRASSAQMEDQHMRLALWLPADEEPLEDRTLALGRWCSGFLAGVGSGTGGFGALSAEAEEALDDLRRIAQAEAENGEDTEQEETAFFEIVEYVRIVALLLREDLRGPGAADRIH